jgi:DNA-binding NarL/FixJ family response regulator
VEPAAARGKEKRIGASEGLPLSILFLDTGSHAISPVRSGEIAVTVRTAYDKRFRDLFRLDPPHWVVLDQFVDDQIIREILFESKRSLRRSSVLLLGQPDDYGRCECWTRSGVRGYLVSTSGEGRILEALSIADREDLTVTDACFHRAGLELAARMGPAQGLTSRELEILSLARNGYRSEDIARALHLTLHTVEFHVRNANAKLGARSRAQAVARAIFLGLISCAEIPTSEGKPRIGVLPPSMLDRRRRGTRVGAGAGDPIT